MPLISKSEAPSFNMYGADFIGLASPKRGSKENAVWIVSLSKGSPPVMHQITREEIFVCLQGRAVAQVGAETYELSEGSALVVPAYTDFQLSNPDDAPFKAVVVLPVGAQALIADNDPFIPPWAN
jgi:mannose-6-phosphate isomerase-like protein (cupin superfamily)